jgi:cytoskeletal protein RodZ
MTGSSTRRHSPAVYRRRRLVLLVLMILVVALVVWLIAAQPWRGEASERPAPTSTASATASTLPAPGPTAAATEAPAAEPTEPTETLPAAPTETPAPEPTPLATPVADTCTAGDVTVDAVTDQSTYPSGQLPKLSIRLTNHSSTDCTMNVGTTSQTLTVTSGSDTWWRSTDCQTAPSDMIVLVAAGQTVASAQPVEWDRTRSSVSTCGGERQRAPAGGASYHLKVSIGGITSTRTAQFLMY